MKKFIIILAITAFAVTSTFAGNNGHGWGWGWGNADNPNGSDTGTSSDNTPINVVLKSTLEQNPYELSLIYGTGDNEENFTYSGTKTISGLDITQEGSTDEFNVILLDGNLNSKLTFETVISELPFKGIVNNAEYTVNNNLKVRNVDNQSEQSTFTTEILAGPHLEQSVARFDFHWDGAVNLPAGDYSTTNTISISVI
jgi:hypothetical protein